MSTPAGFPEAPPAVPATPLKELDVIVAKLVSRKAAFAALSVPERLVLLDAIIDRLFENQDAWAALESRAKGAWPFSAAPPAGTGSIRPR